MWDGIKNEEQFYKYNLYIQHLPRYNFKIYLESFSYGHLKVPF